eukprot:scaffold25128_cov58-Attheya_sp.AAC.1
MAVGMTTANRWVMHGRNGCHFGQTNFWIIRGSHDKCGCRRQEKRQQGGKMARWQDGKAYE